MTSKLPINLDSLLHHRTIESERVEYLAGWNPEAVLHSICAFANDFPSLVCRRGLPGGFAGKAIHWVTGEVTVEVNGVVTPGVTPEVTPEVGAKLGSSGDQEPVLEIGGALPLHHFPDVTKKISWDV